MKNKEIEELLKGMRDVSNTEGCSMNLDRYLVKLLLSYIEQLEKENENLKQKHYLIEGGRGNLKSYTLKLEKENKKLQEEKDHYKHLYSEVKKQKDGVIEYIKSLQICTLGNSKTLITEIIINILRMLGEIDE